MTAPNSHLLCMVTALACALPCAAETAASATEILQRVSRVYSDVRQLLLDADVISSTFNSKGGQVYITRIGLAFDAPDKTRFEMSTPFKFARICDGKTTWAYLPDQREYTTLPGAPVHTDATDFNSPLEPGSPEDSFSHLTGLLLYRYRAFADAQHVLLKGEDEINIAGAPHKCYVVVIDSTKQNPPFKSGRFRHTWWVDKDTSLVWKELFEGGIVDGKPAGMQISARRILLNQPLRPELFRFVPPAGVKHRKKLQVRIP